MGEGNLAPQVVLFIAQFISGIGGSLYYTLGVSYMDDNTKKSKTPALLSKCDYFKQIRNKAHYLLGKLEKSLLDILLQIIVFISFRLCFFYVNSNEFNRTKSHTSISQPSIARQHLP